MLHRALPCLGDSSRYYDFLVLNFKLQIILEVVPGVESECLRRGRKTNDFAAARPLFLLEKFIDSHFSGFVAGGSVLSFHNTDVSLISYRS